MIGLHLRHEPLCLHISQRQYIEDVGLRFADLLGPVKPTSTPAAGNLRLVKSGLADRPASPPADRDLYRSLVSSLMYAVVSRPDVVVPVSMCARFLAELSRPSPSRSPRAPVPTDHQNLVSPVHPLRFPGACLVRGLFLGSRSGYSP
jgi:hypothetical protein